MNKPRQTLGISKLRRAELIGGTYIDLIGKHEAMVRCLYRTFAVAYPSMKKFWNQLAEEELQHHRLIQTLQADIKNASSSFKRPAFTQSQVQDSIAWICARKERVESGGVSINEALTMCIQIEQGMVEHRFFDVIDEDNEKAKHVLLQLEKSSILHLRRVRIESKRLKWRIFGNKVNKPIPAEARFIAPIDGKEDDPKIAIRLAQAAILAALIGMEDAASSLYETYAELLPESADLWGRMAAEEKTHATMLHQLEDMLDKGVLFNNMGQFGVSGLKKSMDDLLNAETQARRDGITYHNAMIMALRTESYMAECEFYRTVDSCAPEFKYIATRLMELTDKHIKRLQEATGPMTPAELEKAVAVSPRENVRRDLR